MTDPNHLLDRYLDDQLSAEELNQLEQDLASNAKYADAFAAAMMIDALLEDRFERDAIASAMQLQDGSFLGEEDLRVLQDDYDHAVTDTVTIIELNDKPSRAAKGADQITASQAVSVLSYEFKQLVRTKPKPFIMSALAAAAVLLLALIVVNPFASDAPDPIAGVNESHIPSIDTPAAPTSVVATLTAERDAQWQGASGTALPGVGDGLQSGDRLVLTAGLAEITTKDGAVAILEAPVTVELFDNNNAIHLHAGKLVGICETESSKGFLVRTPHMNVTDLGTRFGVDVARGLATEVHVHQGEVVVAPPQTASNAKPTRQHLTANQAVRSNGLSNAIVSITPAFEKFDNALSTYRLRGTGFGLAEGAVVPNWQVVADANGALDTPLRLIVQHSYKPPTYTHFPAIGNDPTKAQWLFFAASKSNYYPLESPADLTPTRLVFEGRVHVPEALELEGKTLYLRFAHNEGFNEVLLNSQAIEPVPERGSSAGKILFHEVMIPIDETTLRHGENVIRFDLPNGITANLSSFYLEWEIRPASTQDNNEKEKQP